MGIVLTCIRGVLCAQSCLGAGAQRLQGLGCVLLGEGVEAHNHWDVRSECITGGERCVATYRHLLDLTVLGKKTNDEIVNLFGGDVCESRLLELGDHVLVVAVAHVGSIQWGVNFVAGCVITACDSSSGQDACNNQRDDSFHHVPQRMRRP